MFLGKKFEKMLFLNQGKGKSSSRLCLVDRNNFELSPTLMNEEKFEESKLFWGTREIIVFFIYITICKENCANA